MNFRILFRQAAVAGFAAAALFVGMYPASGQSAQTASTPPSDKPYTVEDGNKVDPKTYNGYRRYHSICHTCHGPDGLGSSFAPSLVDSLKRISSDQFEGIVAGGVQGNNGGNIRVMPAFASDPNVMDYILDIYSYLKARSDGALGRGRPERIVAAKTN
ncbi:c-type cytochrome [Azospirillum sp.]|uniref:c-type cytochrome n=1 Tax=Azospirillum sp. TaxID=34012 RepID=UPI003D763CF8